MPPTWGGTPPICTSYQEQAVVTPGGGVKIVACNTTPLTPLIPCPFDTDFEIATERCRVSMYTTISDKRATY
jgi:hypothetical protein